MNLLFRRSLLVLSLCLCAAPLSMFGQPAAAGSSSQNRSKFIQVSAPLAQKIVLEVKTRNNSDLVKLGLHAVPPGDTANVIIGSTTPSKIGKKASATDLKRLAEHKPVVALKNKAKTFDLLIPITDRNGGDLDGGFVTMEIPFAKAANEKQALKIGIRIRNQMQRRIPSRAALYQPESATPTATR